MKSDIKIGIIGAGGVGQALAVALTSEDYDVEVASRSPKGIRIDNACSFSIMGDLGDKTYLVPTVKSYQEFQSDKDIIILATKARDAVAVIAEAQSKLKPDGVIVTIQNMFFVDSIMKLIPSEKSVCMYLDMSFKETDNGVVVCASGGATVGVYSKDAYVGLKKFSDVLSSVIPVDKTADVFGFVLGRNILNWAISSLGAISGLKLGDILCDRNGRYLFTKIISEGYFLCKKFRIQVVPYANELDYELFTTKSLKGWLYRRKMLKIIRKNNYNVRSSALADLEKGKHTELEFLLAKVLNYAEKCRFSMPYVKAIYSMLKEIENGTRRIEENAFYDKMLIEIK